MPLAARLPRSEAGEGGLPPGEAGTLGFDLGEGGDGNAVGINVSVAYTEETSAVHVAELAVVSNFHTNERQRQDKR